MKPTVCTLLLSVCLYACSATDQQSSTAAETAAIVSTGKYNANASPAPLPPLPACYLFTDGKDSTLLRLRNRTADGEISGDLEYREGSKQQSSGSFFGRMVGDTLVANFSYLQKEKRKVREVAFLRRGDGWLEGAGPSAERSGIRTFTNRGQLRFGDELFENTGCQ